VGRGAGTLRVALGGTVADLGPGDLIHLPASASVKIDDGGPSGGSAWVTTNPGTHDEPRHPRRTPAPLDVHRMTHSGLFLLRAL
jgi:hypothetical protein